MDQNFFSRLKYITRILSPRELKLFQFFSGLFLVSFIGIIIGSFFTFTEVVPRDGGTYTEALVGKPRLINPLYAEHNSVDRDLVKLLYAGLVRFDGEQLVPDVASSWEISDDQKTYTFFLRDTLTWPDGHPFDAQDVVYTISTIKDPAYQSPLISQFSNITVEALDERTVQFVLPQAHTPFLELLTIGILPEHIWSNIPPESVGLTDFNIQPLGLGPYQFKQLTKNKFGTILSYTLERNEYYHRGKPHIKEITFKFFNTNQEALDALRKRNVDGVSFLSSDIDSVSSSTTLTFHSFQLPQYTAVFFNLSSSSPVENITIRKALAFATNKKQILTDGINTYGEVINGPILPGYPGYHESIETFPYSPERAAGLLEDEGWVLGDDDIRHKDDQRLSFTLTTSDTPELTRVADIIKQQWEAIGVAVELNIVPISSIHSEVISSRSFDVLLFGEIVGLDPDPYPFWHSSQISAQGLNLSNFKHPEADTVLEEARQTSDMLAKEQKYIHFQNILVAELPALFLYTPYYLYPVDSRIQGITQSRIINPSDRYADVHLWYTKTRRTLKTRK